MTALTAALVVAAFALVFAWLRVPAWAAESLAVAGRARRALADPALDDGERERAAQRAARRLFYVFAVILARTAAAAAAAAVPLLAAHGLGVAPAPLVGALLARPDVLLLVALVLLAPLLLGRWRPARWR